MSDLELPNIETISSVFENENEKNTLPTFTNKLGVDNEDNDTQSNVDDSDNESADDSDVDDVDDVDIDDSDIDEISNNGEEEGDGTSFTGGVGPSAPPKNVLKSNKSTNNINTLSNTTLNVPSIFEKNE